MVQEMLGFARQRTGRKLMKCCWPEQAGTKEHDKMLKRTQVLDEGRVLAKEARNWKIEGQKSGELLGKKIKTV